MQQLAGHPKERGQPDSRGLEEQLRSRGKTLVDLSVQLVAFERRRILDIIDHPEDPASGGHGWFSWVPWCFFMLLVSRKIVRPLRVIESTTRRIAQGDFKPLPVLDTRDETQRVVEAFNRMVAELEKRQDQLVQGKKMSSLGVLTAGIAHQLNNPLNNISTSCQIILEELDQGDLELLAEDVDQRGAGGLPGPGHRQGPAGVLPGPGLRPENRAPGRSGEALHPPDLQPGAAGYRRRHRGPRLI